MKLATNIMGNLYDQDQRPKPLVSNGTDFILNMYPQLTPCNRANMGSSEALFLIFLLATFGIPNYPRSTLHSESSFLSSNSIYRCSLPSYKGTTGLVP